MLDTIENFIFKVSCWNDEDMHNYIPKNKRIMDTCKQIEDLKYFEYIGLSRIDGFPMFRLNISVIRLIKIKKIRNKDFNLDYIRSKLIGMENKIEVFKF